jgi:anti-sigma regulatory factor (Ser/Thr protein kinase)
MHLSTSECQIEFATCPKWFRTIRQLISAASTQCGFSDRDAGQIAMAVDEAISNIYRHGYHGSTEGRVRLNFFTTASPNAKITIIKPGGLGVHLIQTVMDTSTWIKRAEGGMKLTMSKIATSESNNTLQSKANTHG